MTWFESLFGIHESSPDEVRAQLACVDGRIVSRATGAAYAHGTLDTPALAELRAQAAAVKAPAGKISVREIVGDARTLHAEPSHAGAWFQVASQFNLLEMASPMVTPERGVGRYEDDRTQGPACATAAGAGTVYRNYFVPVGGGLGQAKDRQIDCLAEIGAALGNTGDRLWTMTNGYALPTRAGLEEVATRLGGMTEPERDGLRGGLRIGFQRGVQVTLAGADHLVNQAYCSALPVAYSHHPLKLWEPFARLVLEAAYEATLRAAALGAAAGGSRRVFLTLLGGGAFGNEPDWILDALARSLDLHDDVALEVGIVSYRASDPMVAALAARYAGGR